MTTRREFIGTLAAVLAAPLAAEAQPAEKMYRIGNLSSLEGPSINHIAFRTKLRELGWIDGKNITSEDRFAGPDPKRLSAFAKQLVDLPVDLIVASGGAESVQAAKNATKTIPIVFGMADDPIRAGLVSSLSRPGANITGLSSMNTELDAKRLALLKEALPQLKHVAVLKSSVDPSGPAVLRATEAAARTLGVQLQVFEVQRPQDLDDAFATAKKRGLGAVMILGLPTLFEHQRHIAELATKTRLPVISPWRQAAQFGALVSYGADISEMFRRVAVYVDKILRGTKPGDLPVEQPTKFELVINLKTAQALGLTIPPSLLARADEVIR
ncbi:MAG TPA: ABC transporter substrate-binding protein [Methylomirabilota bacterium]|nr:ABC transporter substrate-binding protein [Methylomirabilota bacterium]